MLTIIDPSALPEKLHDPLDAKTVAIAAEILAEVQRDGEDALRAYAERFGDVQAGAALVVQPDQLKAAFESLPIERKEVLTRTAERIRRFATAQRAALANVDVAIPGGRAGQTVTPVRSAGCYAPGGRFPLPSSVLMTVIPARVAGVKTVWVASPRPAVETLAAAHVAGADALLAVGGAQAVAALAYGCGSIPACDVIVGPGNRFVTAAKKLVAGQVGIDMLAGPSELVVFADQSADPAIIAADLLAQAEHDPDALPVLVALGDSLPQAVNRELAAQLDVLPTAEIARLSLKNGFAVMVSSLEEGVDICNRLAPEHLEIKLENAEKAIPLLHAYGALFIGEASAEVLGDYGAGPNHVLPTGKSARFGGGLSVFNFLAIRTWLRIDALDKSRILLNDAIALAEIEGLHGHAEAARKRLKRI
jgi:phosphoribosyl-ATP pyrophosphohydrolase/phosphoribosyl-AMP cyclohydrolase/histidinol dehydrogenase